MLTACSGRATGTKPRSGVEKAFRPPADFQTRTEASASEPISPLVGVGVLLLLVAVGVLLLLVAVGVLLLLVPIGVLSLLVWMSMVKVPATLVRPTACLGAP